LKLVWVQLQHSHSVGGVFFLTFVTAFGPLFQIRNEVGLRDEEGCVISHAERLHSQELFLASGRQSVIDYDMTFLLLAPMEMAGAVMGVLIQTILPYW
jgi:hypothetical protein